MQKLNFETYSIPDERHLLKSIIYRRWIENYRKFSVFCRMKKRLPVSQEKYYSFNIGGWLQYQRKSYDKGIMPLWQYKALAAVESKWECKEQTRRWKAHFEEFKKRIKNHDSPPSLFGKTNAEKKLFYWVKRQREFHSKGRLDKERVWQLDNFDRRWRGLPDWDQRFENAVTLYEKMKSGRIFDKKNRETAAIVQWCNNTLRFRNTYIPKSKKKILQEVAKAFSIEGRWEKKYMQLKVFIKKEKRLPRSNKSDETENSLHVWWRFYRANYKIGSLKKYQIEKLQSLKMNILTSEGPCYGILWEKKLKDMEKYYNKYNRFPSARDKNIHNKKLGIWTQVQRTLYNKGKLKKERIIRITAVMPKLLNLQ